MAMGERLKIKSNSPLLYLNIYKGHYATAHSHINYYIDITEQKCNLFEAKAVAKALAANYKSNTMVDTVLCLDGTEVIGACLANELSKTDFMGINSGRDISILTPEYTTGSQLFFRDNIAPMITGKYVLILAASVVTGYTSKSAVEAINYYSGSVVGITSIFATVEEVTGIPVTSVFNPHDLPGYSSSASFECPMCKQGQKIDALVNSFGCSLL